MPRRDRSRATRRRRSSPTIEAELQRAAVVKKRLLMVGRSRYTLPLSPSLEQKFAALSARARRARPRELGRRQRRRIRASRSYGRSGRAPSTGSRSTRSCRFASRASCVRFAPMRCSRRARRRPPCVLMGRKLARVPTKVIADIHGDPAAPARLYGSPRRRALAPLADALARYGLRRSDGVRTISAYTSGLVRDGRRRADSRVRRLHGSRAVRRVGSSAAARAPGCAVRRRPRALQGGRRARGGVAPSRRRECPTRRCTWLGEER